MNRMRGKMRFWSKTKHGEKKLSREKQAGVIEAGEKHGRKKIFILRRFHRFFVSYPKDVYVCHPAPAEGNSPPHSPDLEAASPRIIKDSKENKEPSPKMKRRRSLKISSINLEPTQWQNDALHILTSTHDYRSMNDFLLKKARPHLHTHTHTHAGIQSSRSHPVNQIFLSKITSRSLTWSLKMERRTPWWTLSSRKHWRSSGSTSSTPTPQPSLSVLGH